MTLKDILQGKSLPSPLHPILVHLPLGLWVSSFIFDCLSFFNRTSSQKLFYGQTATTVILLGVIAAIPAAVTGFAEFIDIPRGSRVRSIAVLHAALNNTVFLLYTAQLFLRRGVGPTRFLSLLLNLAQVGALGFSGMLGKKMVYQYRMGQRRPKETGPLAQATDAVESARERAAAATEKVAEHLREPIDKLSSKLQHRMADVQKKTAELAG